MYKIVNSYIAIFLLIVTASVAFFSSISVNALSSDIRDYWTCVVNTNYDADTGTVPIPAGSGWVHPDCTGQTNGSLAVRLDIVHNCIRSLTWNRDEGKWDSSNPGTCELIGMNDGAPVPPGEDDDENSLPDLDAGIKHFDISDQVSCWMSNQGKTIGPNLATIWNPSNFLPLMYGCDLTDDEGRPLPLHPVNMWPIAIRVFGFFVSLLIYLAGIMIIVYAVMLATSVAVGTLKLLKKGIIALIAAILFVIFLYVIVNAILSVLGLQL